MVSNDVGVECIVSVTSVVIRSVEVVTTRRWSGPGTVIVVCTVWVCGRVSAMRSEARNGMRTIRLVTGLYPLTAIVRICFVWSTVEHRQT